MKRMTAWPVYVAFGLGALASSVCSGQSPADSLSPCTSVTDDMSRLKCYDDRMAHLGYKVSAPKAAVPARVPAPSPQAAAPTSTPGEFGLEGEALRKKRAAENPDSARPPEELVARVKAVSERAHGEFRIELDNGQIWLEIVRTGGTPPGAGETVTIKRGVLGSYFLTRHSGLALRVKRIR